MKKLKTLLFALLCAVCCLPLAACAETKQVDIQLFEQQIAMQVGDQVEAMGLVKTEGVNFKDVTIDSSNDQILLCEEGVLTAVGEGQCFVVISYETVSVTLSVVVTAPKTTLEVPQNLRYENGALVWDSVSNASGYVLKVGDSQIPLASTSYTPAQPFGENEVAAVKAVGVGEYCDSEYCENYNFSILSSPIADIKKGYGQNGDYEIEIEITNFVLGDKYDLLINDVVVQSITSKAQFEKITITHSNATGQYVFHVRHTLGATSNSFASEKVMIASCEKLAKITDLEYSQEQDGLVFQYPQSTDGVVFKWSIFDESGKSVASGSQDYTCFVSTSELVGGSYSATVYATKLSQDSIDGESATIIFDVPQKLPQPTFVVFNKTDKTLSVSMPADVASYISGFELYAGDNLISSAFAAQNTYEQDGTIYQKYVISFDHSVFVGGTFVDLCARAISAQETTYHSSIKSQTVSVYKQPTPSQPKVENSQISIPGNTEAILDGQSAQIENGFLITSDLSAGNHMLELKSPATNMGEGVVCLESDWSEQFVFAVLPAPVFSMNGDKVMVSAGDDKVNLICTVDGNNQTFETTTIDLSNVDGNIFSFSATISRDGAITSAVSTFEVVRVNISSATHSIDEQNNMIIINLPDIDLSQFDLKVLIDNKEQTSFNRDGNALKSNKLSTIYKTAKEYKIELVATPISASSNLLSSKVAFSAKKLQAPTEYSVELNSERPNYLKIVVASTTNTVVITDESGNVVDGDISGVANQQKFYARFAGNGKDIVSSDKMEIVVQKLSAPTGISPSDNGIRWNEKTGNQNFEFNVEILLEGQSKLLQTTANCNVEYAFEEAGTYTCKIYCMPFVNGNNVYLASDAAEQTIQKLAPPTVEYNKQTGLITVSNPTGQTSPLKLFVAGQETELDQNNQATFTPTQSGSYEICAQCVGEQDKNTISSSQSSITITKLETPSVDVDENNFKFNFSSSLENVTFVLSVEGKEPQQATDERVFDFSEWESAEYSYELVATSADGLTLDSEPATGTFKKRTQLTAPTNFEYDASRNLLIWDAVDNAISYTVIANDGRTIYAGIEEPSKSLDDLTFTPGFKYEFTVTAVGDDNLLSDSSKSETLAIKKATKPSDNQPKIENNILVLPEADEEFKYDVVEINYDKYLSLNEEKWQVNLEEGEWLRYRLQKTPVSSFNQQTKTYYLAGEVSNEYEVYRLCAPTEIEISQNAILTFERDEKGTVVAEINQTTLPNFSSESDISKYVQEGQNIITLQAKGNGKSLLDSQTTTTSIEKLAKVELALVNGSIVFPTPVEGASVVVTCDGEEISQGAIDANLQTQGAKLTLVTTTHKEGCISSDPTTQTFSKIANPTIALSADNSQIIVTHQSGCAVKITLLCGEEVIHTFNETTQNGTKKINYLEVEGFDDQKTSLTVKVELKSANNADNTLANTFTKTFYREEVVLLQDFAYDQAGVFVSSGNGKNYKYWINDVLMQSSNQPISAEKHLLVPIAKFGENESESTLKVQYWSDGKLLSPVQTINITRTWATANIKVLRDQTTSEQYLEWDAIDGCNRYILILQDSTGAKANVELETNSFNLAQNTFASGTILAQVICQKEGYLPSKTTLATITKLSNPSQPKNLMGYLQFNVSEDANIAKYLFKYTATDGDGDAKNIEGSVEFNQENVSGNRQMLMNELEGKFGTITASVKIFATDNTMTLDSDVAEKSFVKFKRPPTPTISNGTLLIASNYMNAIIGMDESLDYHVVIGNGIDAEVAGEFVGDEIKITNTEAYKKVVDTSNGPKDLFVYYRDKRPLDENIQYLTSDRSQTIRIQSLPEIDGLEIDNSDVTRPIFKFNDLAETDKYIIYVYEADAEGNPAQRVYAGEHPITPEEGKSKVDIFSLPTNENTLKLEQGNYIIAVSGIGSVDSNQFAYDDEDNKVYYYSSIQAVGTSFSVLDVPQPELFAGKIRWKKIDGATSYLLMVNNQIVSELTLSTPSDSDLLGKLELEDFGDGYIYCEVPSEVNANPFDEHRSREFDISVRAISSMQTVLASVGSELKTIYQPNIPSSAEMSAGGLIWTYDDYELNEYVNWPYSNIAAGVEDQAEWNANHQGMNAEKLEILQLMNAMPVLELEFSSRNSDFVYTKMISALEFRTWGFSTVTNPLNQAVTLEKLAPGYYNFRMRQLGNSINIVNGDFTDPQIIRVVDAPDQNKIQLNSSNLIFEPKSYDSNLTIAIDGQEYHNVGYYVYAKDNANGWVPIYYITYNSDEGQYKLQLVKKTVEKDEETDQTTIKIEYGETTTEGITFNSATGRVELSLNNTDGHLLSSYTALALVTVGNTATPNQNTMAYLSGYRTSDISVTVLENPASIWVEGGNIKWTKIANAEEYSVKIVYDDGYMTFVSSANQLTLTDDQYQQLAGKNFNIQVRAIGNGKNVINAPLADGVDFDSNAPTFSTLRAPIVTLENGVIKIDSDKNSSGTIVTCKVGDQIQTINLYDSTTFVDNIEREEGVSAEFRFVSVGSSGSQGDIISPPSEPIVLTKSSAPTNFKISATALSWDNVADTEKYEVVIVANSGSIQTTTLQTNYIEFEGIVELGEFYEFKVRAIPNSQTCSASEWVGPEKKLTKLPTPQDLKINDDGMFSFSCATVNMIEVVGFEAVLHNKTTGDEITLDNDVFAERKSQFDMIDGGTYTLRISSKSIDDQTVLPIPSETVTFDFEKSSSAFESEVILHENQLYVELDLLDKTLSTTLENATFIDGKVCILASSAGEQKFRLLEEGKVMSKQTQADANITKGDLETSFDDETQTLAFDEGYSYIVSYTKNENEFRVPTTNHNFQLTDCGDYQNVVVVAYNQQTILTSQTYASLAFNLFGNTTGDGSEQNPYSISNENFATMLSNCDKRQNAHFVLTEDITYNATEILSCFYGNLNGDGKKLVLTYAINELPKTIAMFEKIDEQASIKNLTIQMNHGDENELDGNIYSILDRQEALNILAIAANCQGTLQGITLTGNLYIERSPNTDVCVAIVGTADEQSVSDCKIDDEFSATVHVTSTETTKAPTTSVALQLNASNIN